MVSRQGDWGTDWPSSCPRLLHPIGSWGRIWTRGTWFPVFLCMVAEPFGACPWLSTEEHVSFRKALLAVNIDCQPGGILNHPGDNPLSMHVRGYLEELHCAGKTQPECRQNHSMSWHTGLTKVECEHQHSSHCASWPKHSHLHLMSCHYTFIIMIHNTLPLSVVLL